jgi:hypothetical protein
MVLTEAQIIEKEALVCLKPLEVSLGEHILGTWRFGAHVHI